MSQRKELTRSQSHTARRNFKNGLTGAREAEMEHPNKHAMKQAKKNAEERAQSASAQLTRGSNSWRHALGKGRLDTTALACHEGPAVLVWVCEAF